MGFGVSRTEARQLVRHNGITVNGKKVNIPSYNVQAGDVVAVAEKAREQLRVKSSVEVSQQRGVAEWIDVDAKKLEGVFKAKPERSELPAEIQEQLVVELYSK
jgi:small subunit ribosomal protein S4